MIPRDENIGDKMFNDVEEVVTGVEQEIKPIRQSVMKRFPTLFLLLVTFGATATLTGMEQLLIQVDVLHDNPLLMVVIGIVLLAITGRLYKKLD